MSIVINSLEYQSWHEVGHAIVCLHLGGGVEFVELLDDERASGLARARCSTNTNIRPSVACGGFAAELFLLRNNHLEQVDEKEITQIIFRNATKDREIFCGRTLRDDEIFKKEEDESFMCHAVQKVVPIMGQYFPQMKLIVRELLNERKIHGSKVRELLCLDR